MRELCAWRRIRRYDPSGAASAEKLAALILRFGVCHRWDARRSELPAGLLDGSALDPRGSSLQ
jgi:hypothetical protein